MSPLKVQAVLSAEFLRLIRSRVFQLSLVLVPLFSLGLGWLSGRLDPVPAAVGPLAGPAEALVPALSMALLFLMVMLTTPQMMSSVIEEKMGGISEVLLASVTPFDLMFGKLLACAAAAALVGLIYLALGLGLAAHLGYTHLVGARPLALFAFFLALAVFLHGSLFMAIGAACSEPREAQGMLAPLVLLAAVPLITLRALAQAPGGAWAKALSLFPLSAPFVMCFRLNSADPPGPGEIACSVGLTLAATGACVWAAARIFRVGLLAKGKAPGPAQLWKWVFRS